MFDQTIIKIQVKQISNYDVYIPCSLSIGKASLLFFQQRLALQQFSLSLMAFAIFLYSLLSIASMNFGEVNDWLGFNPN